LLEIFSVVYAASPSATHPKMVECCNHTAQASSHHAGAEDGHLKRPYPSIVDGDNWVAGLVAGCLVGYGVGGHLTGNVPGKS
jgi:hypothetical protein